MCLYGSVQREAGQKLAAVKPYQEVPVAPLALIATPKKSNPTEDREGLPKKA